MGYRDESERLRARVAELETELSTAQERIAHLSGERGPDPEPSSSRSWLTGGEKSLTLRKELPFEVSDEGYEAIARLLPQRLKIATVPAQVGRTLTYGSVGFEFRIARIAPDRTEIAVRLDRRSYTVLAFVAWSSIVFFGLLPLVALLKATGFTPQSLYVALPLLSVLALWPVRATARHLLAKQQRTLTGTVAAVADVARRYRVASKVRVDEATEDDDATDDRLEGEQAGPAKRARSAVER